MSKKPLFANWRSLILFAVSPAGVATGANNALIPLLPQPFIFAPPLCPRTGSQLIINRERPPPPAIYDKHTQRKGGGSKRSPLPLFFSFFVEEPVNYSWVEIARWRRRFGNPAAATRVVFPQGERTRLTDHHRGAQKKKEGSYNSDDSVQNRTISVECNGWSKLTSSSHAKS